jgi:hypothetical protein
LNYLKMGKGVSAFGMQRSKEMHYPGRAPEGSMAYR